MKVITLQSGSNGNCVYVEGCGVRLLLDAGISGLQAQRRLAEHRRDIHDVDAVIISHDHADHSRCAGVYQRKFHLPLYAAPRCLRMADARCGLGELKDVHHFEPGQTLHFGRLTVQTVPTPHDGIDAVAFVVCGEGKKLGVLTDLGHVFEKLSSVVASLNALILESNYDPEMLRRGPYPPALQRRILGPGGHLSNVEAAELVAQAATGRLKWLCLAHLSEQNNTPQLALDTHRKVIPRHLRLLAASRWRAGEMLQV